MSVYDSTSATIASVASTSSPFLHVRTDPYTGRKYHASSSLPANTDLLGPCAPYSYTIWKRFRNEVCAECWRYDRGRRTFLTCRDDDGLQTPSNQEESSAKGTRSAKGKGPSAVGAGLWFCDSQCQQRWIAREGAEAVDLLRQLEGARQKKTKTPPQLGAHAQAQIDSEPETGVSQEVADRAWRAVEERETSPKEVRKWSNIQLDDYETDMARYVLLALLRRHRERLAHPCRCQPTSDLDQEARREQPTSVEQEVEEAAGGCCCPDPEWRLFASLQVGELPLLRACPEILEHQTRIYQLLKGRFTSSQTAYSARHSPSRSQPLAASSPIGKGASADELGDRTETSGKNIGSEATFGKLVTVANVRRILGVDPGNSFGIWEVPLTEESECLGFAVYPIASFFNHHCSPNVRKEREGRVLRFLSTRGASEGEELCISYGHVEGMGRAKRQEELLEGWYFRCRCSRCEDSAGEVGPRCG